MVSECIIIVFIKTQDFIIDQSKKPTNIMIIVAVCVLFAIHILQAINRLMV